MLTRYGSGCAAMSSFPFCTKAMCGVIPSEGSTPAASQRCDRGDVAMVVSSSSVAGGVMESGMERPHCWRLITKGCHLDLVLQGADEAFPQRLYMKNGRVVLIFSSPGWSQDDVDISSLAFRHAFDWTSCVFSAILGVFQNWPLRSAGRLVAASMMHLWEMWIGPGSWVSSSKVRQQKKVWSDCDEVTHRQRIFVIGDMNPTVWCLVAIRNWLRQSWICQGTNGPSFCWPCFHHRCNESPSVFLAKDLCLYFFSNLLIGQTGLQVHLIVKP